MAAALVLALVFSLAGCTGSKSEPFWGQWILDNEKTMEANKAKLKSDDRVAVAITLSIFSKMKVEIREKAMAITLAGKTNHLLYQVEGDTLVADTGKNKLKIQLIEDGKYLRTNDLTSDKAAFKTMVLARKKD